MVGQRRLGFGRAILTFALAYVIITALAFGLYEIIAAATGMHAAQPMKDPAYLLAEKYYPLLNLAVWVAGGWLYFRRRSGSSGNAKEALWLGAFWLLVALPVDLIGFVLIPNPLSLNAHDFYVGQFPWIYLTYLAVFIGPTSYVGLARLFTAST